MQKFIKTLGRFASNRSTRAKRIAGRRGSASVGVITVVDEELRELKLVLKCSDNVPGTGYWVQQVKSDKNYQIVLKQLADRGNLASAEAAKEVIEDFRPNFLLLVGISGGMAGRDGTAVGDVVVVDYVDYYEFRKLADGRSMPRKIPFDHPSKLLRADVAKPILDEGLWKGAISHPRPGPVGECKGIIGNLITGEKLLADHTNQTQRAILNEYDKAIAVDMEACGIARAVFAARGSVHYNVQYAVIRGVSDLVDAVDNDAMRQLWRPYAANVAATFAGRMIETMLRLTELPE